MKPFPTGHKFSLQDVRAWVTRTGGHDTRLAWFEVYGKSTLLYTKVAKTLLSVTITGSMTAERIAKPLKHSILIKERNRLGVEKASMNLRAGLNLRFLQHAKDQLRSMD